MEISTRIEPRPQEEELNLRHYFRDIDPCLLERWVRFSIRVRELDELV